ncbi:MAG: hypothetical protein ACR2P3_08295 [Geminicoccaceae bacterium]
MFDHIGWIIEAGIADGRRDAFKAVVAEIVAETCMVHLDDPPDERHAALAPKHLKSFDGFVH